MSAEKILKILKDEKWHSIAEMSKKTRIKAEKIIEFSIYLAQKAIANYEEEKQRVKIEPEWSHMLPDEEAFL